MGFRQTFKGIFQFSDQAALERAMAENQSEASGADAMGLQDGFRSAGVMLLNIDAVADQQDWEEMSVAVATLAMHAARGFLYAVAFDKDTGQKSLVEYYEAPHGRRKPHPANTKRAPLLEGDYFPLLEGSIYSYQASGNASGIQLRVQRWEVDGLEYFSFQNPGSVGPDHCEGLDGTFFSKVKSQVFTVDARNERELQAVDPGHPRSFELVHDNRSQPGDVRFAIRKRDSHFSVATTEPRATVVTPAGTFQDCQKVRTEVYRVEEENMTMETFYQYFAKGVGLVKFEKGDAWLELKSYALGE
jgi:hypothetical protein